jgi:hypothetical protein
MKPPLPRIESAVPRTLHAQLEIAKAMRTLMAPDDDELLRRRRAEIAAIRGEFEAIKRDFQKAGEECLAPVKAELRAALAKKYNPDQPRVSAGNRDGGQWASDGGSGASPDLSGDRTEDVVIPRTRYAQAETSTRGDASSGGNVAGTANSADTVTQDTSLWHNLWTVGSTIWTRNDPERHKIWSYDLPEDHPRAPVEFVDSDGVPIHDNQGQPIFRPTSMPPERYVAAGLANQSLGTDIAGYKQQIAQGGAAAEGASVVGPLVLALLPVAPGGMLDAERFDFSRVRDYRHYLNIMIGVYGATMGLDESDVLSTIDEYARLFSRFDAKEPLDNVYTHSARQDVEDTKLGYKLYRSGRIRLRP